MELCWTERGRKKEGVGDRDTAAGPMAWRSSQNPSKYRDFVSKLADLRAGCDWRAGHQN